MPAKRIVPKPGLRKVNSSAFRKAIVAAETGIGNAPILQGNRSAKLPGTQKGKGSKGNSWIALKRGP